MKFDGEGRQWGRGSWKGVSKIDGLGERCRHCTLIQQGSWWSPDRFGRTKNPENTSSGRNCRLVPVSRFYSAEPLDTIGRTLRFRRTPVEKQWSKNILAKSVCDDATIAALQKYTTLHATFKNRLHIWNHPGWHQIMNWWQPKCFGTVLTKNLQQISKLTDDGEQCVKGQWPEQNKSFVCLQNYYYKSTTIINFRFFLFNRPTFSELLLVRLSVKKQTFRNCWTRNGKVQYQNVAPSHYTNQMINFSNFIKPACSSWTLLVNGL